jgi:hypothetical protein
MLRELAVIRQNWTKGYYVSPCPPQNFHPATAGQVGLPLQ